MVAPAVGGGFGSKLNVYAEEALALALARRLGRPVKWIEERSEATSATIHGRDQIQEIELAATAEGKIRAVRAQLTVEHGRVPPAGHAGHAAARRMAVRRLRTTSRRYDFECTGVFTNTTPTDAYRGAGRPEATYAIERAVDALARKLGKDPVELRRLNFIARVPVDDRRRARRSTPATTTRTLDAALEIARLRRHAAEQQTERRERGDTKQLGIGFSTYVEMCGLAPSRVLGAIRYGGGRLGRGDDPLSCRPERCRC